MNGIVQYLRQSIGLDSASIGTALIERNVRLRMKCRGLKRLDEYLRLISTSSAERDELFESVVVTETWFFRDHEPFCAFVRVVLEEWLPTHSVRPLRVLSIPCASGEEPYSLAIALLEAGLSPDRFDIEGVDISARALARAQRAIFKKNSFRGKDLSFRDRHFRAAPEGFELSPQVRSCVHFHQANVLDDSFATDRLAYDYIFCRNLLIYFDRVTQQRALEKIRRLLAPSGVLWVGAAEHPLVTDFGFVSAQIPRAFACRHAGLTPVRSAGRKPSRIPARAITPHPPNEVRRLLPAARPDNGDFDRTAELADETHPPGRSSAEAPAGDTCVSLEAARRLADGGRLHEAIKICDQLLKQDGASADAFYLSGLVREAAGEPGALDCYRKALYLDPEHYEALLQMALRSEKEGDSARARTYRNRALRSSKKSSVESPA